MPRLRLMALHYLAAAEWQSGRPDAACEHLAAAQGLYDAHATPLLRAQRCWLEGRLALRR